MIVLFSNFLKTLHTVFLMAAPVYNLLFSAQAFPFLHILATCVVVVVVQSLSRGPLFVTPLASCGTPGFPVLHYLSSLLKFMSIESLMLFNHIILCCPLLFPWSLPSIRSFLMSQLIPSGGQGDSVLAPVLPMNIQGWFPLEMTGFISLLSKGLTRVFSSTAIQKHQFFSIQPSLWFTSHMTTGKTIALTIRIFVGNEISLFF